MLNTRRVFRFLQISRTRLSASAVMGQTVAALWAFRESWPIDSPKPTFRFMLWNLCDRIMEFGHMNTTQHRYRLGKRETTLVLL